MLKKHLGGKRFLDDAGDDGTEWLFENDLIISRAGFLPRGNLQTRAKVRQMSILLEAYIERYNRQFIFHNKSNLFK